ncbi:hypothetical protein [Archangium sp.]|uniref:hypothetical protein n=1 Tax=Archangium sp. TaxID=1872627 RepID=UPI002D6C8C53|nr:hypothetical protein [Archangium sp.]HYO52501.1 hypothetical protein [Archangium sp.]
MYLTSQRVSAPGEERTGINTYLYRHGEAVPSIDWSRPDLARIVDEFPGTLVAHATEVPPGGNLIRSYLDIVAPDSMRMDAVDLALQQFDKEWSSSRIGQVIHMGGVAFRLGLELRLEARAREELRDLSLHALALLRKPAPSDWEPNEPLRVVVTTEVNGRSYALDEPSSRRLQSRHGAGWRPTRLSVTHDVQTAMSPNPVDLGLNIAPVLTGLALDELVPFGGIRFIDEQSGNLLWEWPSRVPLVGYCLSCHQQATLRATETGFQCVSCGNQQDTNGLWVAALT